jgi:hypothetical protein
VNHVERVALLCGFSVERVQRDYGVDLIIFTYSESGEVQKWLCFRAGEGNRTAAMDQGARRIVVFT